MSKTMGRTLRPQITFRTLYPQFQTHRTFLNIPGISLPNTSPQTLTATRILPYKSTSLYTLIADINNYSTFLPYCQNSKVTKWSEPDKNGKMWPSEADLTVGWGGVEETFTSRLFCVPGKVVEALGGEATTMISREELGHHTATLDHPAKANAVFQSIRTRWSVRPFQYKPSVGLDQLEHDAEEHTEVNLAIEFQFSNPIYAALSQTVAPKVAGVMIEAFEVRARNLLDGPGTGVIGKI